MPARIKWNRTEHGLRIALNLYLTELKMIWLIRSSEHERPSSQGVSFF